MDDRAGLRPRNGRDATRQRPRLPPLRARRLSAARSEALLPLLAVAGAASLVQLFFPAPPVLATDHGSVRRHPRPPLCPAPRRTGPSVVRGPRWDRDAVRGSLRG